MTYNIKEVADMFNITANKLRFYEKKGLLKPNRQEVNDYREYSHFDIQQLQMILTYRALDISVDDIKKLMEKSNDLSVSEQLFKQLKMVNHVVHKYERMQSSMQEMLNQYLATGSNQLLDEQVLAFGKTLSVENSMSREWQDLWNFDDWAFSYDQAVLKANNPIGFYSHYDDLLDKIFESSKEILDTQSRVLEIGIGTGNLANRFIENGINLVGLDQSMNMLMVAKKKHPNLSLRLGEFLQLPFRDDSFDLMVSSYAFHHLTLEEKGLALKEASRVLSQHGSFIIGDIIFSNQKEYEDFMATDEADEDEFYTVLESFTPVASLLGWTLEAFKIDDFVQVMVLKKDNR